MVTTPPLQIYLMLPQAIRPRLSVALKKITVGLIYGENAGPENQDRKIEDWLLEADYLI